MAWVYDEERLKQILQGAGYDVLVTDVVQGHKRAQGVWEVFIDKGGRLRFVATATPAPPQGRRVTKGGRRYNLLREGRRITNIVCQLSSAEELAEVLRDLEELATQEDA